MAILITVLIFVLIIGLCIGSFLNVCILRALSGESIVFPASKCPKCGNKLKWWHNIPVLSYIFLRGKCGFCKEHISIQYPIIEILTGIIFTLEFMYFGITLDTLFMWIISALLIIIAGTDIKEKVVFDVHTYSLIGVSILYAVGKTIFAVWQMHHLMPGYTLPSMSWLENPLTSSVLGALAGVIIMEIFARLGYLVAGTRAFGEGDTLIAAGMGALFGWYQLIFVLILSAVIQVLIYLPIFIKGLICNKDWKTLISFVSFAVFAVLFCLFQNRMEIGALYIVCSIILAVLGGATCIFIFKNLREKPENRTYLPFGPAMVSATFFVILAEMMLAG
ncbi:prepilin peptidase [bacterium]|nr:prepilin peptidase [bacterium]